MKKENKKRKVIFICVLVLIVTLSISIDITHFAGTATTAKEIDGEKMVVTTKGKELKNNTKKTKDTNKTNDDNKTSIIETNSTGETKKESKPQITQSIVASPYTYSIDRIEIKEPTQYDFGKYYNYAMQFYNYIISGSSTGEFTFDSRLDFDAFNAKIQNLVLASCNIPELKSIRYAYTSTSGSLIIAKPMNIGHNEYAERKSLEGLLVSICGYQTTDKALIDNLNSWLMNNTSYDYSYSQLSYDYEGILYNRKAVCNGFARFIKKACDMYGVSCYISEGIVNTGGYHTWNKVQIGGIWYYIDPTWNVCNKNNSYYLSTFLWRDHTI